MIQKRVSGLVGFTAWLLLAAGGGCERSAPQAGDPGNQSGTERAATAALPADLFVTVEPPGARPVGEVKQGPAATGDIVVRGRIGGRTDPFVAGRAVFMLADAALPTCAERHGDGCPTPWDYCCEPRDKLIANTATIQVVGPDGQPLRTDVANTHGLKPTAEVVVVGTVRTHDAGALVVDARQIWVKP